MKRLIMDETEEFLKKKLVLRLSWTFYVDTGSIVMEFEVQIPKKKYEPPCEKTNNLDSDQV